MNPLQATPADMGRIPQNTLKQVEVFRKREAAYDTLIRQQHAANLALYNRIIAQNQQTQRTAQTHLYHFQKERIPTHPAPTVVL